MIYLESEGENQNPKVQEVGSCCWASKVPRLKRVELLIKNVHKIGK
jgi:hypothetical protein